MNQKPAAFQRASSRRLWTVLIFLSGLLLIALIGFSYFVALFFTGGGPELVARMKLVVRCENNHLMPLAAAVDRYYRGTDHYPKRLEDLYPEYVEKQSIFHCPADTRPRPEGASYIYHPPVKGKPTTPLLECRFHPPVILQIWPQGEIKPGDTRWELRTQIDEKALKQLQRQLEEQRRKLPASPATDKQPS